MNSLTKTDAGRIFGLALAASAVTVPAFAAPANNNSAPASTASSAAVAVPDAHNMNADQLKSFVATLSPEQRVQIGIDCGRQVEALTTQLRRTPHKHVAHGPDRYQELADKIDGLQKMLAALSAPPAAGAQQPDQGDQRFVTPYVPISKALYVPGLAQFSKEENDLIDASGCNYKGFWNMITSPMNAECKYGQVSHNISMAGHMVYDKQTGTLMIALDGPAVVNPSATVTATGGKGWLEGAVEVGGLLIGAEDMEIARDSYNLSAKFDGKILSDVKGGNVSLFGSLSCGTAVASQSSTKNVTAVCNLGDTGVNSNFGVGGTTSNKGGSVSVTSSNVSTPKGPGG